MKPLKLVMQAFGPYPNRETVDFEELSKDGIFLIKGPTGSGKTTIFDAMSMALYGKSTVEEDKSKGGRNSLEIWRCNQADWETETLIEFTFLAGDRVYKFVRRLVPKRTKLDPVYAVCVLNEAGDFIALDGCTKESELSNKAEEIIGFNSSQFRQVVLLPQGKFERFLVADSNEKEQILSRLFDASQWDMYAKRFYDMVDARRQELVTIKQEVDIALRSENQEIDSIDLLRQYIAKLNTELEELEEAHNSFDAKVKKDKLEEDKKTFEKFSRLMEYEATKNLLESKKSEIEEAKIKLEGAKKAEGVREGINKVEELAEDLAKREEEVNKIKEELPELEQIEKSCKTSYDKKKDESPVEDIRLRIGMLNSKIDLYAEIDKIYEEVTLANEAYKLSKGKYETVSDDFEKIRTSAADSMAVYNEAEECSRALRNKYYADIYGDIASKLEEGKPCPICGSKEHPNKAPKGDDDITKEAVDEQEAKSLKAKKAWEKAESIRIKAETELVNYKNALDEANNRRKEADTRYKEASKNLIEGINSTEELSEEIERANAAIEDYENELKQLNDKYVNSRDKLQNHKERLLTLEGELNKSLQKYKEESERLNKDLTNNGYSDIDAAKADMLYKEEMDVLFEKVTSYETRLKTNADDVTRQLEVVDGLVKPDATLFASRQQELDEELEEYTKKKAALLRDVERLTKKENELAKKLEYYESNIHCVENDMAFAKKLRGDTGIGLERYVLGIMFNQIILEANRMLLMVHGGRYHLLRTDDKGAGNKRGLELLVHDNRKPEETGRPVGSLSGGEKFLVSLSLSIGMSNVAQKSGLHIEALFIDEGFGTLDENSISDAMDILECVQKNSGMIGIISHVAMLENNIPTHLEVIKTQNGSRIKVC